MSHELVDCDGNAVAIIVRTSRLLYRAGLDKTTVEKIIADAKSADYDHLLQTCVSALDEHLED